MDVKRYFELLELGPDASMEELNQAYKDMVNIWHPDRFAHNARLRRKAEEKLKEVNEAYEALKPLVSSEPGMEKQARPAYHGQGNSSPEAEKDTRQAGTREDAKSEAEAIIETGTANVLRVWSYLSMRLRRAVSEQVRAFKQEVQIDPREGGVGRGQGRGKATAKGRGGGQGRKQFRGGGRRGGSRGGMRGRGF